MTVSTLSDETPLQPDDELLVAYLDGELDRQEQSQLEDRLMTDADLRRRLQQLQSSWDMLDEMPDPTPSMRLVESTLELAVSDIVAQAPTGPSRWNRIRMPLLIAGLCLLGVIIAVSIVSLIRYQDYRRQLRDVAIVEHLDAYLYGQDVDLMRELIGHPDWFNMIAAAQEVGDFQVEPIANLSSVSIGEREERLQELPPEKANQLDARWERFMRLSPEKRAEARATAEAVSLQADAESLLKTMRLYALWRETLPSKLRDEIEGQSGAERREAIRKAIAQTRRSITRRSGLNLDEPTIDAIYTSLQDVLQQRVQNGDSGTIAHMERYEDPAEAERFTIARIVWSGYQRDSDPRQGPPPPRDGRRNSSREQPASLSDSELQMLRWELPSSALSTLDLIADGDRWIEMITLQIWAEESVRRKLPFRRDDESLWERYQQLPENERELIDLLPPKDFLKELTPRFGRFPR